MGDLFQDPTDTTIHEYQVPYIKWHGICKEPVHILLYTLNNLLKTNKPEYNVNTR
jgi:hypothetical protein